MEEQRTSISSSSSHHPHPHPQSMAPPRRRSPQSTLVVLAAAAALVSSANAFLLPLSAAPSRSPPPLSSSPPASRYMHTHSSTPRKPTTPTKNQPTRSPPLQPLAARGAERQRRLWGPERGRIRRRGRQHQRLWGPQHRRGAEQGQAAGLAGGGAAEALRGQAAAGLGGRTATAGACVRLRGGVRVDFFPKYQQQHQRSPSMSIPFQRFPTHTPHRPCWSA